VSIFVNEQHASLLRDAGLSATTQRLSVLRVLGSHPHQTADEIVVLCESDLGTISRQSVYDALAAMSEKGIIRRVQPLGSPARYEDRVGDNHHHVVCRLCGSLANVDCATGETPCLTAVDDMGFDIDEAEVIYWGRCGSCREAGREFSKFDQPTLKRRNQVSTNN
jgi:Fur family ferric uptake transcriptional regulator